LTTGHPLFRGDSDLAILEQIAHKDAPPPTSARPDYPATLEPIVMRALRREPAERYGTVKELQLALEAFAREAKLVISASALSAYVEVLFAGDVAAWHRARETGISLGEHLTKTVGEPATAATEDLPRDRRSIGRGALVAAGLMIVGAIGVTYGPRW